MRVSTGLFGVVFFAASVAYAQVSDSDLAKLEQQLNLAKQEATKKAAVAHKAAAARAAKAAAEQQESEEKQRLAELEASRSEQESHDSILPPSEPDLARAIDAKSLAIIKSSEAFRSWPHDRDVAAARLAVNYSYKTFTVSPFNGWHNSHDTGCTEGKYSISTLPGSIVIKETSSFTVAVNIHADDVDTDCDSDPTKGGSTSYALFGGLLPVGESIMINQITGSLFPERLGSRLSVSYQVSDKKSYRRDTSEDCTVIDDMPKLSTIVPGDEEKFVVDCHQKMITYSLPDETVSYDWDTNMIMPFFSKSKVFSMSFLSEYTNESCLLYPLSGTCKIAAPVINTPFTHVVDSNNKVTAKWIYFNAQLLPSTQ